MALDKFGPNAFATGSVTSDALAADSVTTTEITDDAVTSAKLYAENLGRRNIFINGAFDINQYNDGSSTSFSSGAAFVADRWDYYTNSGAFAVYSATHEISTDAPSDFSKSLKITCTSGGTIPSTGEVIFRQNIEGYNSRVLAYGSSDAKDATVSFWVKASVVGDYGLQFVYYDGTDNHFYVSSYTVDVANTWEYKTVTIPGQTSNAFDNVTNGNGLTVYWDLGEGSDYSAAANSGWTTTYKNGLTGGVKLMENTGATWQITGIQLEASNAATEFEHRSHGEELSLCQRYYWNTNGFNNRYVTAIKHDASWYCSFSAPITMRTDPTTTANGGSTNSYRVWDGQTSVSQNTTLGSSAGACGAILVTVNLAHGSTGEGGLMTFGDGSNVDRAYVELDAEL